MNQKSFNVNKQLILKNRPVGTPDENTWELIENKIPEPGDGEILVEQYYISLDPAMRGWMNDAKSYIPPVQIGEVMRAGAAGKVIKSNNPKFKEGDYVYGWGGVQQYSVTDGKTFYKVDKNLVPLPVYTGTLGMPGMTAYFGILDVGKIKEGETVLVSGAAGAVGSIVGQIAKIKGCHVIGIAGGKDKCQYLIDELGFDSAIDYKNENVRAKLKEFAPKGIDVYFDNVGGEILDLALARLRKFGRVVLCGAISQYNATEPPKGPANYLSLLINSARMEGFIVMNYASRYAEAGMQMGQWMAQGKLKSREHIDDGIENFYSTFMKLFTGEKKGKLILKVAEEN